MLVADFAKVVRENHLVSEEVLQKSLNDVEDPNGPADSLAKMLVDSGSLTSWQAKRIAKGQGEMLVLEGRYQIIDKIGEGGMGTVFLGRIPESGQKVAIKVPRPDKLAQNPNTLKRFRREALANGRLEHPNIVRALDVNSDEKLNFIVFELVEGEDFDQLVARSGALPLKQAVDYAIQIAEALQCIHEHGVVHRDLKPSNLLVTAEGQVKLLDLGFARLVRSFDETAFESGIKPEQLTKTGIMVGTLEYMAPEQAQDTRQADIRSDIYGLGCTFFELVSARPPFQASSDVDLLMKHINEPPPKVPGANREMQAIFEKMLAKEPAERYQTPAELLEDLRAWQNGDPPPNVVIKRKKKKEESSLPFAVGKSQRVNVSDGSADSSNWWKAGIGAAVVAVLALGALAYQHGGRTKVIIEWPEDDRQGGVIQVDNHEHKLPAHGPLEYESDKQRRVVHLQRDGYEPLDFQFDLERGASVNVTPEWRPLPETTWKLQIEQIDRKARAAGAAQVPALRRELIKFSVRAPANLRPRALSLLAGLASPLDALAPLEEPPAPSEGTAVVAWLGNPLSSDSHWSSVHGVAISPDNKWFATAGSDDSIRIWNMNDRKPIRAINVGSCRFSCVAISPDGRLIAAGSRDKRLFVWDSNTGEELVRNTEQHEVTALAFAGNDKVAVTGGNRHVANKDVAGFVSVVEARSGSRFWNAEIFPTGESVAAAPDGRFAIGCGDGSIILGDVANANVSKTIEEHPHGSVIVTSSPDGKWLFSAGADRTLRLWSWRDARLDYHWTLPASVRSLSLVPPAKTGSPIEVAALHTDGRVRIWTKDAVEPTQNIDVLTHGVLSMSLSSNRKWLTVGDSDGAVRIYDFEHGRRMADFAGDHCAVVNVAFGSEDASIISLDAIGTVIRWDPSQPGKQEILVENARSANIAASPDGQWLAIARLGGKVAIHDLENNRVQSEFTCDGVDIHVMAFSPEGDELAIAASDHSIWLWNVKDQKETRRLRTDQAGRFIALSYGASAKHLISIDEGGGDQHNHQSVIRLWNLSNGQPWSAFSSQDWSVTGLAANPDGKTFATVGGAGNLRVWDQMSGNLELKVKEGFQLAGRISFHPSGQVIGSGGQDGSIYSIDTKHGYVKSTYRIARPGSRISRAVYSHDGRYVASGNGNGSVAVVRLAPQAPLPKPETQSAAKSSHSSR